MSNRECGYTIIETLSSAWFIVSLVVLNLVLYGITGNYWYSEKQVLRALKAEHPGITEILNTKRKVFAESVIMVRENGKRHDYCLDTNILQNYRFSECPKTDKKWEEE